MSVRLPLPAPCAEPSRSSVPGRYSWPLRPAAQATTLRSRPANSPAPTPPHKDQPGNRLPASSDHDGRERRPRAGRGPSRATAQLGSRTCRLPPRGGSTTAGSTAWRGVELAAPHQARGRPMATSPRHPTPSRACYCRDGGAPPGPTPTKDACSRRRWPPCSSTATTGDVSYRPSAITVPYNCPRSEMPPVTRRRMCRAADAGPTPGVSTRVSFHAPYDQHDRGPRAAMLDLSAQTAHEVQANHPRLARSASARGTRTSSTAPRSCRAIQSRRVDHLSSPHVGRPAGRRLTGPRRISVYW